MLHIHWAILFSTSCFANLLGLNISSAFNSAVTIYILIPILLIPQLILSGVVVKFDKLNPIIGNTETVPLVGDLMASRWAFAKPHHFSKTSHRPGVPMRLARASPATAAAAASSHPWMSFLLDSPLLTSSCPSN